jgi:hypothetical protein
MAEIKKNVKDRFFEGVFTRNCIKNEVSAQGKAWIDSTGSGYTAYQKMPFFHELSAASYPKNQP